MSVVQHYIVSGMTCRHCVTTVGEEVSAVVGVTEVDVDLDSGALTVASDAELPFELIQAAVGEAGYTVMAA